MNSRRGGCVDGFPVRRIRLCFAPVWPRRSPGPVTRLAAPTLAAALVVTGALAGCRSDPLPPPDGIKFLAQTIDQEPRNEVDLLFVIDDSEGMAGKQEALIAGFPALLRTLQQAPGGQPNLRVGVVSSNLGAGGSRLAECDRSERGLLQAPREGCAPGLTGRYLISTDGGKRNNFEGDLSAAFACLAELGTGGCGFEQHLGAARRALDPADQPLENEDFLRPRAVLGLVVLADEDDCSTRAATDLFEPATSRYGAQGSFRCAEYGHLCGGAPPPRAGGGPLAGCRSAEGAGKLNPVAEYVSFFQSLKAQPERLLVSVIAAPSTPYAVQVVNGQPQVAPSCRSQSNGPAAPAVRLEEFARSFGGRGQFSSVCDDDLAPALTRLGEGVIQQLGSSCLTLAPVRTGGVPDCQVSERAAALGPEVILPRCTTGGARPCWNLTANRDQCPSGVELKIERSGGVLPGTFATALCRVCTDPKDTRCM